MILTNDSKKILYKLYAEYRDRRKHGFSKSDSKNLDCAKTIHDSFFPDLPLEDVEDSLCELKNNNFIHGTRADGTVYKCELSDYAIATMENLPKETLASIGNFISNFIP